MANPEHLKKLEEGVEAWNRWRKENPDVFPDLKDVDLGGADLSEANLTGADIKFANLNGAFFYSASLREADLTGSDLSWAELEHVYMPGAILRETNLTEAHFRFAILEGVDLTYSTISFTKFNDVDLGVVYGLERLIYHGPPVIGVSTLQSSKGKIPIGFLINCGLSPWEIEMAKLYDPDLTPLEIDEILATKIFQKRTEGPLLIGGVFISYSHTDSTFVDKLYKELQDTGGSVWLDKHDMLAGNIERQVMRQIRIKDIVVLVLSESSIKSDWVETELEEAREKEKSEGRDVLCPVAIDDSWRGMEGVLWRKLKRDKHILDFTTWETGEEFKRQFQKLIKGMQINYP